MADRAYTDADLDAAITALSEPGRLREAQDVVARAAPALQRVLDEALHEGGWFDSAHEQAVREAAGEDDLGQRALAVRTLIAEETRLGMLVGRDGGLRARARARPRARAVERARAAAPT